MYVTTMEGHIIVKYLEKWTEALNKFSNRSGMISHSQPKKPFGETPSKWHGKTLVASHCYLVHLVLFFGSLVYLKCPENVSLY